MVIINVWLNIIFVIGPPWINIIFQFNLFLKYTQYSNFTYHIFRKDNETLLYWIGASFGGILRNQAS